RRAELVPIARRSANEPPGDGDRRREPRSVRGSPRGILQGETLNDESRSGFAMVAVNRHNDQIRSPQHIQPSASSCASIHVSTSFSARLFLATARLCRRTFRGKSRVGVRHPKPNEPEASLSRPLPTTLDALPDDGGGLFSRHVIWHDARPVSQQPLSPPGVARSLQISLPFAPPNSRPVQPRNIGSCASRLTGSRWRGWRDGPG